MKRMEWTKRRILQAVYWGVFALMAVAAVIILNQDGLYLEDSFDQAFYKLESSTESQRIFTGEGYELVQEGFFPESDEVTITVRDSTNTLQWTLKRGENWKITAFDGETEYEGTYSITDWNCSFYFDDWEKYMSNFEVSVGNGVTNISERYASEAYIGGLIRMAYGHSDNFGRYSMEVFVPWIILVLLAYVLGFHAQQLFELRKAFEFDYRNAAALEPSDWYFFSSYFGAAAIWLMSLFIYLVTVGVIG